MTSEPMPSYHCALSSEAKIQVVPTRRTRAMTRIKMRANALPRHSMKPTMMAIGPRMIRPGTEASDLAFGPLQLDEEAGVPAHRDAQDPGEHVERAGDDHQDAERLMPIGRCLIVAVIVRHPRSAMCERYEATVRRGEMHEIDDLGPMCACRCG